jgi:hypothetical protein
VFAIGRDSANGRIVLRGRAGRRLDIVWPYDRDNASLVAAMTRTMEDLAQAYGGELSPSPTWPAHGC